MIMETTEECKKMSRKIMEKKEQKRRREDQIKTSKTLWILNSYWMEELAKNYWWTSAQDIMQILDINLCILTLIVSFD